jgi:hypothetical protein
MVDVGNAAEGKDSLGHIFGPPEKCIEEVLLLSNVHLHECAPPGLHKIGERTKRDAALNIPRAMGLTRKSLWILAM